MINDRARIVEQVRLWAGATSDAVLDPSMDFFTAPNIEGFIAYRVVGNIAAVYGDPTCPKEAKAPLALAFREFVEDQGKRTIYITVSRQFAHWAIENIAKSMIEFGEELVLDPFDDPQEKSGTDASLVRRKVKHAAREAVSVHEYLPSDPAIEQKIEQLGHSWQKNRKGMQLHISNVYQFNDRHGKRWFYAKKGDQILAVLTLNQLKTHQGWLLNHLMTAVDAPHGTSELLITTALEALKQEKCRYVTVGIVTNKALGKIVGLGKFSQWAAHQLFKLVRKMVNLDGLNAFWIKFDPRRESSYLLFSQNRISIRELIGLRLALRPKCSVEEKKHE